MRMHCYCKMAPGRQEGTAKDETECMGTSRLWLQRGGLHGRVPPSCGSFLPYVTVLLASDMVP